MADLTEEMRHAGRRFANKLEEFTVTEAPDLYTERRLHRLIAQLRSRYGYSHELKKRSICLYLDQFTEFPFPTRKMIAEHFRWHRDDVKRLIDELVEDRRVEIVRIRPVDRLNRGRPSAQVRLRR